MFLSKNFNLEEFTASSTAVKHNINNTPTLQDIAYIRKLVDEVLQPIRDKFNNPIKINSGFRSYELNTLVGGSDNSDHRFGCAADITSNDNKKLWDLIISMIENKEIKCRQLIDESNLSWIHISINHPYNKHKNNQILKL